MLVGGKKATFATGNVLVVADSRNHPSTSSNTGSTIGLTNAKSKAKRRATFGGSRLSLHSLFFPASYSNSQKEKMSLSANDLVQEVPSSSQNPENSGTDSCSDRDSLVVPTPPASKVKMKECPLCFLRLPASGFPRLSCCTHRSCQTCFVQYLQMEILESRVMISCPECTELLHPTDIYFILAENRSLIEKYEEFSLRRVLMADPDTRWCPAPDCSYAVIASGCAACPEIRCDRPGCDTQFCYHCKMVWHPNQTCDEARAERGSFDPSPVHFDSTIRPGDIKACPRCRTYIVKMNDGSCNHMICAICGVEFCWLCLKEISDLHYLSPSGCTFWGKKPWSKKKKLLWQLATLIGAPVGIALIAGLAVPAIIFGVPVFVGRKVYQKLKDKPSKTRRHMAIVGSVAGSLMISPVLATMAVGVGVPLMLLYVYGVVPLSLCRNGNCGVSASSSGLRLDVADEDLMMISGSDNQEKAQLLKDSEKLHDGSTVTAMSIHSGSSVGYQNPSKLQIQAEVCGGLSAGGRRRPSVESGGMSLGERYMNYEEASVKAMAGSTYCDDKSVHTMGSLIEGGSYCEDQASTKALSGSVVETKSICGGASTGGGPDRDNSSVRALAGSIGPDSLSARHFVTVETHHYHHHNPKSDRGSPAPLLEEEMSDADIISSTSAETAGTSIAVMNSENRRRHRSALYSASSCSHHVHLTSTSSENIELLEDHGAPSNHSATGAVVSIGLDSADKARPGQSASRLSLPRHSAGPKFAGQGPYRGSKRTSLNSTGGLGDVESGRSIRWDRESMHSHEPSREEGEFMLLSADAFHQLHPNVTNSKPKKARSVSLLLDSSPGEIWHMLSDAGTEPWTVWERMKELGRTPTTSRGGARSDKPGAFRKMTKSTGSYTSLPDTEHSLTASGSKSSKTYLPKVLGGKGQQK